MQVLAAVGGVLWISGIALMLGYALVSTAVLKEELKLTAVAALVLIVGGILLQSVKHE